MTNAAHDGIQELKAVLAESLPWHGARIRFLAWFLLSLLKVRSVRLAELATGFGVGRIEALLSDREVVGEAWFRWLQQQRIPCHQRLIPIRL